MFINDGKAGKLYCSFCNKLQKNARKVISGTGGNICDECVFMCDKLIQEDAKREFLETREGVLTPYSIKNYLDKYIVGQDQAKKVLSVAAYNHYKRIVNLSNIPSDSEIEKSNILLAGSTGTGKTLLVQTLARILNVPFVTTNATSLTEVGYIGEDVDDVISSLFQSTNGDIKQAERGIVYIDEIDKISKKSEGRNNARDISGEGVQQALLKLIEGKNCNISQFGSKKYLQQDFAKLNTSQILFIFSGAFVGLEAIIKTRLNKKNIGFNKALISNNNYSEDYFEYIQPDDLIKFGFIPEFVGRLPIIVPLSGLSEDSLVRILTEPRNALVRQYACLLKMDGIELKFTEDALKRIARETLNKQTGARGLRTIFETVMMDVMYNSPEQKNTQEIIISEDIVINKLQKNNLLDFK